MKLKSAASNKEPRFRIMEYQTRPTKIPQAIYFLQENVLPDLNNINSHWIKTSIRNFKKNCSNVVF